MSDENTTNEELVIPEDLSLLSDDELGELHTRAVEEFDAVYESSTTGLTDEDIAALTQLTQAIEGLLGEQSKRDEAAEERTKAAAELAQRIGRGADEEAELASDDEDEAEDDQEMGAEAKTDEPDESLAAAASERRIPLPQRRRLPKKAEPEAPKGMKDFVLAADVPGFTPGEGMDWAAIGRAVDRRLSQFNLSQYQAAASAGRHIREQNGVALIHKPVDERFAVTSTDLNHVEEKIANAVDQSRLPGGSLVASGGWCAPSEVLYDFLELETTDGLLSVPEITVNRGGVQVTLGIDYSTIYAGAGFDYTEAEDIAGDYDGAGGGTKPCYKVECPTFTDHRLDLYGVCITAGLLQTRGYPEVIARSTRGALVAHEHKMNAAAIAKIAAGSTAVTMTAAQEGSAAPVLDAIEMQVQHYRYVHRLSRSQVLEAVFPAWTHGVIRSDLSRRQGVDLLSVTDAQINGWFAQRGVAAQFVYGYQDITGDADAFVAWPSSLKFLLYVAGTWVKGTADVITLDTIYDSVLLGTNDFTALFTEEGMLIAKRFADSREVTVPLAATGSTHIGVEIAHDGTKVVAP